MEQNPKKIDLKFAHALRKSTERLAKKFKVPMYLMDIAVTEIPFSKGVTELVTVNIYSGTKPTLEELEHRETFRVTESGTVQ